ncbi:MAG TPA: ABC transporter permease [Bosea sp. (in: a-proteobacteria)]
MNRAVGGGLFSLGYALLFFLFLFGPLIIMVITAFNSSSFPRIVPWECFTTDWFGVLFANQRLMSGLWTSLWIALAVVALSVPLGLAGALALSDLGPKARVALYGALITPILIPGVVIGISTIVFWGAVARGLGAGYDSPFFNGIFLTLLGQVSFIASYTMLIFMSRLQRFDPLLTEAALDLGATPGQAFRKILLPFLKPAIGSAAFIAFLASFENYNTTVFTILSGNTFTTALASKVRLGTDPSLSALAVIIIAITLVGAMVKEAQTRRSERQRRVGPAALYANPFTRIAGHPATIFLLLVGFAAFLAWQGTRHDASVCRANILREKQENQERLLREQPERMRQHQQQAPAGAAPQAPSNNPSPFGGAFNPNTLAPPAPTPPPTNANPSPFGGAFDPKSLAPRQ